MTRYGSRLPLLLLSTMLAASVPVPLTAQMDCNQVVTPQNCDCYRQYYAEAIDYLLGVYDYWPEPPQQHKGGEDNISIVACEVNFEEGFHAFGIDYWTAVNACYFMGADQASVWGEWWYNGSKAGEHGYPEAYWESSGDPFDCCGDLGICF